MKIQSLSIDYIYAMQGTCAIDKTRHIKTLPWLSVVISSKGYYNISLDNNKYFETEESGCFIAPSGVVQDIIHNTPDNSNPMRIKWAYLDVKINGLYKLEDIFDFPVTLSADECKEINNVINEIISIPDDNNINVILERNKLGIDLLKILIKFGTYKKEYNKNIIFAINKIRNNYNEKITIKQLADDCYLSISAFLQKFKKATGLTPIAYINDYRLSIASSLLITTQMSIEKISENTGFYDQFYFSKCFKKKYKLSPLEYRRQQQGFIDDK